MSNKTLFEFINDNWRIWPNKAYFAEKHEISPQRLNGWIKDGCTTDGKNVYRGTTGSKVFVLTPEGDGVEFKIRGIEQCKSGQIARSTNVGQVRDQEGRS